VVFASGFDLLGTNPDMNEEVFVHDAETGLTQITDTIGVFNRTPTISDDGRLIAFISNGNLTGLNADSNLEVFLLEVESGILSQATDTTAWFHESPDLDDTGNTLVILSNTNPTGSNGDNSKEIFVLDLSSMVYIQVTNTSDDGVGDPVISGNGTTIAFRSSNDLVPGSNPDRNTELFYSRQGSPLVQVTYTTAGFNDEADLSWSGSRLAFTSTNDLVPGSNTDLNGEVFIWDLGIGFTQITSTSAGPPTYAPTIDDEGHLIAFISGHEIVPGQNPFELDHLFVWEASTAEFTQITFGDDEPNVFPDVSGSGISVVFYSMGELVPGGNPTGDFQIFARVCGLFRDGFVTGDLRRWSSGSGGSQRAY